MKMENGLICHSHYATVAQTVGQAVARSVHTVRRFVKLVQQTEQQTDHPTLLRTASQFETPPRDT